MFFEIFRVVRGGVGWAVKLEGFCLVFWVSGSFVGVVGFFGWRWLESLYSRGVFRIIVLSYYG